MDIQVNNKQEMSAENPTDVYGLIRSEEVREYFRKNVIADGR